MKRNMFCIRLYSLEWRPNKRWWKEKTKISNILFIMILNSWLEDHGGFEKWKESGAQRTN